MVYNQPYIWVCLHTGDWLQTLQFLGWENYLHHRVLRVCCFQTKSVANKVQIIAALQVPGTPKQVQTIHQNIYPNITSRILGKNRLSCENPVAEPINLSSLTTWMSIITRIIMITPSSNQSYSIYIWFPIKYGYPQIIQFMNDHDLVTWTPLKTLVTTGSLAASPRPSRLPQEFFVTLASASARHFSGSQGSRAPSTKSTQLFSNSAMNLRSRDSSPTRTI